MIRKIKVVRTE